MRGLVVTRAGPQLRPPEALGRGRNRDGDNHQPSPEALEPVRNRDGNNHQPSPEALKPDRKSKGRLLAQRRAMTLGLLHSNTHKTGKEREGGLSRGRAG